MAEEAVPFVSTGATLPVGKAPIFDNVTVGGSTGIVEYVKLMSGSSGSTALVPASLSSNALNAIGLNVSVTNSTANPIGVKPEGGQSSVSVVGNVNVTFSTASTGSVIIANTTAAPANVQLVFNSTLVSTGTPLPVLLQNSTATVTIQGNSTVTIGGGQSSAIISSASIIKVDTIGAFPANSSLVVINAAVPQSSVTIAGGQSTSILSTTGMGGSTGNPIYAYAMPFFTGTSTFASTTLTSTTAWTAFSSAGSTRFILTDIEVTNQGATLVLLSVYDGTTAGTIVDRTYCATAGGGKVHAYVTPVYNTTGNAITVQQDAASTITVNLRGYRSS